MAGGWRECGGDLKWSSGLWGVALLFNKPEVQFRSVGKVRVGCRL